MISCGWPGRMFLKSRRSKRSDSILKIWPKPSVLALKSHMVKQTITFCLPLLRVASEAGAVAHLGFKMNEICRNCHFFAQTLPPEGRGPRYVFSLSTERRAACARSEFKDDDPFYSLSCHRGVWDEGLKHPSFDFDHEINKKDRKNFCYFFPHHEGMLFPAAIELQKRKEEYRELRMSNLYTRIGLYVAAAGLFASAIVEILRYIYGDN